jgi:hypothetical protein
MISHLKNRCQKLANTYWQQMLLAVLTLLILSQVYSWCVAAIEIHRIDTLIEETNDLSHTSKSAKTESTPQKSKQESLIAKNIFLKEKANYILSAIYLDRAVINGKNIKIGGSVGKATLIEIGVWDATIEIDGKTRKLEMFKGGASPVQTKRDSRSRTTSSIPKTKPQKIKPNKPGKVKLNGETYNIRKMSMRELKSLPPEVGMRIWKSASQEDRDALIQREKEENSLD